MRRFRCLLALVVGVCLTTAAAPRPLTVKDVSLMLRSGYSSDDVLREIAARRLLDAPDEATRKALVSFGASASLLAALDQGAYRVDAATADQAAQQAREDFAKQEAQVARIYRDATAVLKEQRARPAAPNESIMNGLRDKLVICRDGTIKPADFSALENKKLIAFYFSAHWCAPCRKFTPQLVAYYQRVQALHPEFEIVFVSSDRSRFNWETYLRDAQMPWPAIDFDQLAQFTGLKQLGGDSIPSLVVVDATGHLVATSYENGKYVGPENALAALDTIFNATAAR